MRSVGEEREEPIVFVEGVVRCCSRVVNKAQECNGAAARALGRRRGGLCGKLRCSGRAVMCEGVLCAVKLAEEKNKLAW